MGKKIKRRKAETLVMVGARVPRSVEKEIKRLRAEMKVTKSQTIAMLLQAGLDSCGPQKAA